MAHAALNYLLIALGTALIGVALWFAWSAVQHPSALELMLVLMAGMAGIQVVSVACSIAAGGGKPCPFATTR